MRRTAWLAAATLAAVVAASPAHGQPADVAAQIKLIETQPADLDRATWKEKRRDAARKLGQSKDRRAVAVLIKLAETETFDIIGEIAIEGLGNLGDPAAAPTLQKIIADPTRDKAQKELARKALGKLGDVRTPAPPAPPPPDAARTPPPSEPPASATTRPTPGTTPAGAPPAGGGAARAGGAAGGASRAAGAASAGTAGGAADSGLLGGRPSNAVPERAELPAVPDDTLAAYERVTFAGGTASAGYDTIRKRATFDADIAGQVQKRIERETMAWGWDAGAHIVGGYINPDGPAVTRGLQLDITGDADARFYSGQLYGIGRAAAAAQVNYISDVDPNNPDNTLKDTRSTADLQIALGAGLGRVLDVGAAIRVRRLARTLEAARALGRPIDAATSRRLQLTWWALRGERSTYRALVATVALLRDAGVLLGEPDAGLSYEILNVLRDSQLTLRPSGLDVQLLFGEGYLQRPDQPVSNESGRVEQLLAAASYGAQLDDDQLELSGTAYGRLRLFAPEGQPSPWAVGATARGRRFTYSEHGDPIGVFDLSAELQISNDDLMNSQLGQRLTGQLGFTWWLNAASGLRLAASVGEDRGAIVFGAELTATYGLLDGTFAR
jgi:HEAT repeats